MPDAGRVKPHRLKGELHDRARAERADERSHAEAVDEQADRRDQHIQEDRSGCAVFPQISFHVVLISVRRF